MNMLRIGLVFLLLLPLVGNSFGSTSGSINEVVSNEKMEMYVLSVEKEDFGQQAIIIY